MSSTLTNKFTLFYWAIFFIIVTPFYLFGKYYVKDILQDSEDEKIHLIIKTVAPTLGLQLSLNQMQELNATLQIILEEKNINSVEIKAQNIQVTLETEILNIKKHTCYETSIKDPFEKNNIADIRILYSYEHLDSLYGKINNILLGIFLFALLIYLLFYLVISKELNALKKIADLFHNYSNNQNILSIQTQSKTAEIQTIARSANEMIKKISSYLHKVENFNAELEKQVQEKVEKLRNQEKMMVHQSRQAAMGEMLESIAHQWRQPLNIIGLSCASLEMENDLGIKNDTNFKEKMQIISKNINYMSDTIDDFRDFLNPDIKATLFDPKAIIESVYDILAAQLEHNKIHFSLIQKESTTLYGIENEFKQVVFVLINNSKDAIKSLQKNFDNFIGKIEVEILLTQEETIITFCDNGGGIKEEIIHSIFEPYFTTKFSSSGTGIGLYMAKNIIESRMHGSIEASNTNKGCCFTIKQKHNTTIKETDK